MPGARILGVRVPALRALAKDLRREAVLDLERACDLMDRLCASRVREEFLVGTFVLVALGKAATAIPWTRLVGWLRAIDNWETCDQLAMGVAAPVLATVADPIAPLTRLARARAPWTRRFAAATAAALCQKGRGLSAPALAVAFELHADADERVQKAVGWAIREASDLDEAAAYRFLKRLRGRMPARVLREAAEKLTPRHRAELVGDRGAAPTPLPTPSRRGTA